MLTLNSEAITLNTLRQLWFGTPSKLDGSAMQRVVDSAAAVSRIVAGGETVYGVNTGFGLLANTRIPHERLAELQRNLQSDGYACRAKPQNDVAAKHNLLRPAIG